MRMKDRSKDNSTAQIQDATDILSYKWFAVVIEAVHTLDGARYSGIESHIGQISSKMLSDALSDLCERQILVRNEANDDNSGAIYNLTIKGENLAQILRALIQWNNHYNETKPSVLIVEDDLMASSALSDYSSGSFDVQCTSSGEDAIEMYSDDVDLVILDRKLDSISGGTVATEIKETHPQALFLVVSGIEPDEDILDLPVDDYMKKPVGERELRNRISLLLNRANMDETNREYLALRSKQLALVESYGASAIDLQTYKKIEKDIGEIALPEAKGQLMEEYLPT